ncbi:hypothetical protein WR25_17889 [Diploscapter pachys]|uniref:Uncharacterized protein n=1 Tax=Diploscapter pachys TaxID=2018661 RepID=A0A2A2JZ31_9BILA|nr:hypothetical protein WR25_17889 [Diploscapter pachys]
MMTPAMMYNGNASNMTDDIWLKPALTRNDALPKLPTLKRKSTAAAKHIGTGTPITNKMHKMAASIRIYSIIFYVDSAAIGQASPTGIASCATPTGKFISVDIMPKRSDQLASLHFRGATNLAIYHTSLHARVEFCPRDCRHLVAKLFHQRAVSRTTWPYTDAHALINTWLLWVSNFFGESSATHTISKYTKEAQALRLDKPVDDFVRKAITAIGFFGFIIVTQLAGGEYADFDPAFTAGFYLISESLGCLAGI